jgi:hypothetical protein
MQQLPGQIGTFALTAARSNLPSHVSLSISLQGILYEDTYLQIGLQSRYTRSNGELLLFLGNKHASSMLTGLALLLSGPSPAVQVVVGQLPPQLAPKQQVQVRGWQSREKC